MTDHRSPPEVVWVIGFKSLFKWVLVAFVLIFIYEKSPPKYSLILKTHVTIKCKQGLRNGIGKKGLNYIVIFLVCENHWMNVRFCINVSAIFYSVTAGLLLPDSEREDYWHIKTDILQM